MINHKLERIDSDIIKYLSNILLTETEDEIYHTITLTEVSINNDLSVAKVYYTSMSNLDKNRIDEKMKEVSPFLRGKLAKVLKIRNIPELKFIYDDTLEYANNIENILKNIKEEK